MSTTAELSRSRPLRALTPERHSSLDMGFLLALGAVALVGFHSTYTGWTFLFVGLVGVVLGLLVAHAAHALRQPVIVLVAFTVAAFFLLGGAVALRSGGMRTVLPAPHTLSVLLDQATHGWKQLLTTLPPVDGHGPLLVLPFFLGLVYGASGVTLAHRARSTGWPIAAPLVLLALVILLGASKPTDLLIEAGLFAALALVWLVLRSARRRPPIRNGHGRWTRLGTGVLLLAMGIAAAAPLAANAWGADRQRVVLRTYVTPPFNVGQYPSPLSSFRHYARNQAHPSQTVYDKVLLRVSGVPDGTRLRFATLDSYNGRVWGASNQAPQTSGGFGTFQRVGTRIPTEVRGERLTAAITTTRNFSGVWVPTIGAVTGLAFQGPEAARLQDGFRYNIATRTGVLPQGVSTGTRYTVHFVVPHQTMPSPWSRLKPATVALPVADDASFVQTQAMAWGGNQGSLMARLREIADHLKQGRFSNGDTAATAMYTAGSYRGRLQAFLKDPIVGDDEQYAATFALMANRIGVPARVVVGAVVDNGQVKGSNVHAWVEVEAADGTWRTIPQTAFMGDEPPSKSPPQDEPQTSGSRIPPPAAAQPPSTLGDPLQVHQSTTRQHEPEHSSQLPAWVWRVLMWTGVPVLFVVVVCGAIVGAKALRRRRRRRRGPLSARLAAGWREVLDRMRDLGHDIPVGLTRREQAAAGHAAVAQLARGTDQLVFGPLDITQEHVTGLWADVDEVRRRLGADLSRRRRVRAALSLTTFRQPLRAGRRG